jgi:hypothetical protein
MGCSYIDRGIEENNGKRKPNPYIFESPGAPGGPGVLQNLQKIFLFIKTVPQIWYTVKQNFIFLCFLLNFRVIFS